MGSASAATTCAQEGRFALNFQVDRGQLGVKAGAEHLLHQLVDLGLDLSLIDSVEVRSMKLRVLESLALDDHRAGDLCNRALGRVHWLALVELVKVESLLKKEVLEEVGAHLGIDLGGAAVQLAHHSAVHFLADIFGDSLNGRCDLRLLSFS